MQYRGIDYIAIYWYVPWHYGTRTVLLGTYHDTPTYNYGSIVPVYMIIVFNDAAFSHCNVPGNDTGIVLYLDLSIYKY